MKLQDLKKEMLLALKEKNQIKKDLLSVLIGAIENGDELRKEGIVEETVILNSLVSFKKQLENSKKIYEENSVDERALEFLEKIKKEIEIIEEFLPKQMTEEKLTKVIYSALETENFKNKNQVLGFLNKNYKGQFSIETAKQIVDKIWRLINLKALKP